jgi:hypothetical protein
MDPAIGVAVVLVFEWRVDRGEDGSRARCVERHVQVSDMNFGEDLVGIGTRKPVLIINRGAGARRYGLDSL